MHSLASTMGFPQPSFRGSSWAALLAILNSHLTLAHLLDPSVCSSSSSRSLLGGFHGSSICPLPVDEESAIDTGIWAPWKRRPYCVEPFMQDDEVMGPQFCVYTIEPFRGDKGLSIVTTPVLAATLVNSLDDSVVPPKLRDHPSSSLAAGVLDGPAFIMKDVPGKGKGLVAQRQIRKWDVVLVDYPAMLTHMDIFDIVDAETRQDLLERALRQLPEKQKQSDVLALARSHGGEPIEDILRTNIFGVELGIEIPHLGLFPLASRVNHDCRPNVFWRWSVRTLAVEVIAMRDIEIGEEITQSCKTPLMPTDFSEPNNTATPDVPLGLSYEDRKEDLKSWGFNCTCSLCTASKSERAASDKRRARLQHIYHELNEAAVGRAELTADTIYGLAHEMESLVREEKLEAQLLVHYGAVARAYMRVGKLDAARKYVEMCEDLWMRYAGEEEDYLVGMHQLRHELTEREKKANVSKTSMNE
ncbi:SET domain-containing protein [Hypoxylon sp. FL0543]|nr:SET domain-containing protein [Hypoxylon sp. FL0543]